MDGKYWNTKNSAMYMVYMHSASKTNAGTACPEVVELVSYKRIHIDISEKQVQQQPGS